MPGGELPTLLPGAGGPDPAAAGAPHSLPVAGLAAMKNLLIGWPQLQELRSAADSNPSSCHDRRRHAATSLAAHRGDWLWLDGVTSLSPEAARALAGAACGRW